VFIHSQQNRQNEFARSYNVKLVKTITADVERIKLCGQGIRTRETGDEEVKGYLKNISGITTSAALIATFYDEEEQKIGIQVVNFRDIAPSSIEKFQFIFTPPDNQIVRKVNFDIGYIVE
jgi:hypothetical protein